MTRTAVLCAALGVVVVAWSESTPADQAVNWTFEDGKLEGWQCKENARKGTGQDADHGRFLDGQITYGMT